MDLIALFAGVLLPFGLVIAYIEERYKHCYSIVLFEIGLCALTWGLYTLEPTIKSEKVITNAYQFDRNIIRFSEPLQVTCTRKSYPFTIMRDSVKYDIEVPKCQK